MSIVRIIEFKNDEIAKQADINVADSSPRRSLVNARYKMACVSDLFLEDGYMMLRNYTTRHNRCWQKRIRGVMYRAAIITFNHDGVLDNNILTEYFGDNLERLPAWLNIDQFKFVDDAAKQRWEASQLVGPPEPTFDQLAAQRTRDYIRSRSLYCDYSPTLGFSIT